MIVTTLRDKINIKHGFPFKPIPSNEQAQRIRTYLFTMR